MTTERRRIAPGKGTERKYPSIAQPEHSGYFARIPLPLILRIERQYQRAERAEARAEARAKERAEKGCAP
jgi:hypothetical protein